MRKLFALLTISVFALAGCGGGDSDDTLTGSPPGNGGSNAPVSSVTVTSSSPTISVDASATAEITALVRDSNNNALNNVTVTFSSPAGSLVVTQATTDSTGQAKATLSSNGAAAGTAIVVTAAAGTVSGTTTVNVVNAQQTITLVTSSPQIASDNSTSATITAYVRNANNQFISGVPVNFISTSGGLTVTRGTTDATGSAAATLNAAGDPTNRVITVTASNGGSSVNIPVEVTGTRLVFTGVPNLVQGNTSTYTATLTNSGNVPIAGQSVAFASSNNNTLSSTSGTTNSSGQATVQVTAATSGEDTVTATALGLTAQQKVSVSSQVFQFTAPVPVVPNLLARINLGTNEQVLVSWSNSGTAQSGQTINFSTTRGTLTAANGDGSCPVSPNAAATSAVTSSSGVAAICVRSLTSGPAVISASATGVSAQTTVTFVATTPTTINVQATPSTVPTEGQSTISAVVRDASNNLVEGQTVLFTTTDSTGGNLTVASAVTDAQGRAQTVYEASASASSSNGVTVTATVQGTSVTGSTTLTVGGQSVFVTLGAGPTLGENSNKTQFIMPYSVTVVDSAGNPVANRQVTLTIHSVQYAKGTYYKGASAWAQTGDPTGLSLSPPITVCPNEDANLNGVRDVSLGEDVAGLGNNNGVLDPGDPATVSVGTVTTDSTGTGLFNVIYPEDHALWVQTRLTATTGTAGSEASDTAVFWLPMLSSYLTTITADPPGRPSPYGTAGICTNPN